MADRFDERFPGWRNLIVERDGTTTPIVPPADLEERCGWPQVGRPSAPPADLYGDLADD